MGLSSWGCKRAGHDLVTKQQQTTAIWDIHLDDTILKKSKDMITIPFGKWFCFTVERNVYDCHRHGSSSEMTGNTLLFLIKLSPFHLLSSAWHLLGEIHHDHPS